MSGIENLNRLKAMCFKDRLLLYKKVVKLLEDEPYAASVCNVKFFNIDQVHEDLRAANSENQIIIINMLGLLSSNCKSVLTYEKVKNLASDVTGLLDSKVAALCRKVFWFLNKMHPIQFSHRMIGNILACLDFIFENKGDSELWCESQMVLKRLLIDHTLEMEDNIAIIAEFIFLALCYPDLKVREVADSNFELFLPSINKFLSKVNPVLLKLLKGSYKIDMLHLFEVSDKKYVLRIWSHVVTLLGKNLHAGGASVVNILTTIIEKGFKSDSEDIVKAIFGAWLALVKNFSTDINVLSDPKRIHLIMRPLKLDYRKFPGVLPVICETYWCLVQNLKERLSNSFEQVYIPLLEYFLSSLKGSSPTSVLPVMESSYLVKTSCEMLIRVLDQSNSESYKLFTSHEIPPLSIGPLQVPLQKTVLLRNFKKFVKATKLIVTTFGNNDQYGSLIDVLIHSLLLIISQVPSSRNRDSVDSVTSFFNLMSDIINSRLCPSQFCLKHLDNFSKLPYQMLTSHYYHLGCSDVMHDNLSIALMTLLLKSYISSRHSNDPRFIDIFKRLANVGITRTPSPLTYAQTFLRLIERENVRNNCKPEELLDMWSSILQPLLEVIKKTQEVNQGDSLENDFTCMYGILLYPLSNFLPSKISQSHYKVAHKLWTDLYKIFVRCSSLIPSVEDNAVCESFCLELKKKIRREQLEDEQYFESICLMLQEVIECINFLFASESSMKKEGAFGAGWFLKQKQKPIGNLTSIVDLIEFVMHCFYEKCENYGNDLIGKETGKQKAIKLTKYSTCLDLVKNLISGLATPSMIPPVIESIGAPLSNLFSFSSKNRAVMGQFNTKLENLWKSVATAIQHNYKGPYDTEFLFILSPLLESTLSHPRRSIQEKSRQFWYATFAQNKSSLKYPDSLTDILIKAKLLLPTVMSNLTDDIFEVATSGSLNDNTPDILCMSPVFQSPFSSKVKRSTLLPENFKRKTPDRSKRMTLPKPDINDLPDKEFVKITPVPTPTSVHRRKSTRKRSFLPAMYNELSQNSSTEISCQPSSDSSSGKIFEPESCKENENNQPLKSTDALPEVDARFPESDRNASNNYKNQIEENDDCVILNDSFVKNTSQEIEKFSLMGHSVFGKISSDGMHIEILNDSEEIIPSSQRPKEVSSKKNENNQCSSQILPAGTDCGLVSSPENNAEFSSSDNLFHTNQLEVQLDISEEKGKLEKSAGDMPLIELISHRETELVTNDNVEIQVNDIVNEENANSKNLETCHELLSVSGKYTPMKSNCSSSDYSNEGKEIGDSFSVNEASANKKKELENLAWNEEEHDTGKTVTCVDAEEGQIFSVENAVCSISGNETKSRSGELFQSSASSYMCSEVNVAAECMDNNTTISKGVVPNTKFDNMNFNDNISLHSISSISEKPDLFTCTSSYFQQKENIVYSDPIHELDYVQNKKEKHSNTTTITENVEINECTLHNEKHALESPSEVDVDNILKSFSENLEFKDDNNVESIAAGSPVSSLALGHVPFTDVICLSSASGAEQNFEICGSVNDAYFKENNNDKNFRSVGTLNIDDGTEGANHSQRKVGRNMVTRKKEILKSRKPIQKRSPTLIRNLRSRVIRRLSLEPVRKKKANFKNRKSFATVAELDKSHCSDGNECTIAPHISDLHPIETDCHVKESTLDKFNVEPAISDSCVISVETKTVSCVTGSIACTLNKAEILSMTTDVSKKLSLDLEKLDKCVLNEPTGKEDVVVSQLVTSEPCVSPEKEVPASRDHPESIISKLCKEANLSLAAATCDIPNQVSNIITDVAMSTESNATRLIPESLEYSVEVSGKQVKSLSESCNHVIGNLINSSLSDSPELPEKNSFAMDNKQTPSSFDDNIICPSQNENEHPLLCISPQTSVETGINVSGDSVSVVERSTSLNRSNTNEQVICQSKGSPKGNKMLHSFFQNVSIKIQNSTESSSESPAKLNLKGSVNFDALRKSIDPKNISIVKLVKMPKSPVSATSGNIVKYKLCSSNSPLFLPTEAMVKEDSFKKLLNPIGNSELEKVEDEVSTYNGSPSEDVVILPEVTCESPRQSSMNVGTSVDCDTSKSKINVLVGDELKADQPMIFDSDAVVNTGNVHDATVSVEPENGSEQNLSSTDIQIISSSLNGAKEFVPLTHVTVSSQLDNSFSSTNVHPETSEYLDIKDKAHITENSDVEIHPASTLLSSTDLGLKTKVIEQDKPCCADDSIKNVNEDEKTSSDKDLDLPHSLVLMKGEHKVLTDDIKINPPKKKGKKRSHSVSTSNKSLSLPKGIGSLEDSDSKVVSCSDSSNVLKKTNEEYGEFCSEKNELVNISEAGTYNAQSTVVSECAATAEGIHGAKRRKSLTPVRTPISSRLRFRKQLIQDKVVKPNKTKLQKKVGNSSVKSRMQKLVEKGSSMETNISADNKHEETVEAEFKPEKKMDSNNSELPSVSTNNSNSKESVKSSSDCNDKKTSSPLLCVMSRKQSPFSRSQKILRASQQQMLLGDTNSNQKTPSSPSTLLASINIKHDNSPSLEQSLICGNSSSPISSPRNFILSKRLTYADVTTSPTVGILKKHQPEEERSVGSPNKKKVRFAEPLVHEKVFDTNTRKRHLSERRVSKIQPCSVVVAPLSSYEPLHKKLDTSNPVSVCPSLINCEEPLKDILKFVTPPSKCDNLETLTSQHNVKTIGDLCSLSARMLETAFKNYLDWDSIFNIVKYWSLQSQSSVFCQFSVYQMCSSDDKILCCTLDNCEKCVPFTRDNGQAIILSSSYPDNKAAEMLTIEIPSEQNSDIECVVTASDENNGKDMLEKDNCEKCPAFTRENGQTIILSSSCPDNEAAEMLTNEVPSEQNSDNECIVTTSDESKENDMLEKDTLLPRDMIDTLLLADDENFLDDVPPLKLIRLQNKIGMALERKERKRISNLTLKESCFSSTEQG